MADVTVTLTDAEGEALMAVTAAGRWAVNGRPWDEQTTNAIRRARQKLVAAALDRARPPAPAPACSRCAFWSPATLDTGFCHRWPPTPRQAGRDVTIVETGRGYWCGEYRAKEGRGDA